jgi:hypothetical protein
MEKNTNLTESVIETATSYGKNAYELAVLKLVDRASDRISGFIPQIVVLVFIAFFLLFINIGASLWIGKLLGEVYFGFFAISGLNLIFLFMYYFFMRKWLKSVLYDFIIRQLMN